MFIRWNFKLIAAWIGLLLLLLPEVGRCKYVSVPIEYFRNTNNLGTTAIVKQNLFGIERLWIATTRGLFLYNGINVKAFKKDKYPVLKGNYVTNLFLDKYNRVVFSIYNVDVLYYIDTNEQVQIYGNRSPFLFALNGLIIDTSQQKILLEKLTVRFPASASLSKNFRFSYERAINYTLINGKIVFTSGRFLDSGYFNERVRLVARIKGESELLVFDSYLIQFKSKSSRWNVAVLPSYLRSVPASSLRFCISGGEVLVLSDHYLVRIFHKNGEIVFQILISFQRKKKPVALLKVEDRIILCHAGSVPVVVFNSPFSIINPIEYKVEGQPAVAGWQFYDKYNNVFYTPGYHYKNGKYTIDKIKKGINAIIPLKQGNFYFNRGEDLLLYESRKNREKLILNGFGEIFNCQFMPDDTFIVVQRKIFSLKHFRFIFEDSCVLRQNGIFTCIVHVRNNLFLLGSTEGLFLFNPITKSIRKLAFLNNQVIIFSYKDSKGRIWLINNFNEISMYQNEEFYSIKLYKSIVAEEFYNIYLDSNNCLWVGTNNGFLRANADSLANSVLYKNKLNYFEVINEPDGLAVSELNGFGSYPPYLTFNDHTLSYPSMGGYVMFNPDCFQVKQFEKPFWVIADAKSVVSSLKSNSEIPVLNYVSPEPVDLQVFFSYWKNPANLSISYRISGLLPDWTEAVNPEKIHFDFLPSGKYLLEIRKLSGLYTSPEFIRIQIVVFPPWYLSFYAWLLYVFTAALAAYLVSVFRVRNIRKRKALLQKQVDEKTEQLRFQLDEVAQVNEDLMQSENNLIVSNQLKEKLIQVVAHDVRSPLVGLQLMTDQIIRRDSTFLQNPDMLREEMKIMHHSIQKLLQFCNDFLKWYNIWKGNRQLLLKQIRTGALIEDILVLHKLSVESQQNTVSFVKSEDPVIFTDPSILEIILRNLIDNANKFSTKSDIRISLALKSGFLEISIQNPIDARNERNFLRMLELGGVKEEFLLAGKGDNFNGLRIVTYLAEVLNAGFSIQAKNGLVTALIKLKTI